MYVEITVKLNMVVDTVLERDYLVYANNFEIKNLILKTIFFMLEKILVKFIFMASSICICCFLNGFRIRDLRILYISRYFTFSHYYCGSI